MAVARTGRRTKQMGFADNNVCMQGRDSIYGVDTHQQQQQRGFSGGIWWNRRRGEGDGGGGTRRLAVSG